MLVNCGRYLFPSHDPQREEIRQIYKTMEIMEENLKGTKLDNVMKELEAKLQKETGIDRNSPAWLKILGRLFVGLTTK